MNPLSDEARRPHAVLRRLLPDVRGLPRSFWVLFAGTLVNRIGGFVLVFLAIYLTEVRGLTAVESGAIISAYGLGAIAGAPLGGALSDRIGRRPTLVASLIGGGASMLVLGRVTETTSIGVAVVITGLLYEMYRPVVSATVADLVLSDDRPRAYALLYWAVNIGASMAPPLGGLIAARSYPALFAVDGATTALYGIILWAALPETRPIQSGNGRATSGAAGVILRDTVFLAVCLLTVMFSIIFFQSFVALPLDMRAHGIPLPVFGKLMALNGALIVLLQPFAGELIRGRSRLPVLSVASLLLGIGFGLNAWVGSALGYGVSIAIWTLGEILFAPAATALVANLAPPGLRGGYQGAFAMAFTGAFAAAPAVGGLLMAEAGVGWLWIDCLAGGVAVAAGFWLLGRVTPHGPAATASRRSPGRGRPTGFTDRTPRGSTWHTSATRQGRTTGRGDVPQRVTMPASSG